MIVEYTPEGQIFHTIHTAPRGLAQLMIDEGKRILVLPDNTPVDHMSDYVLDGQVVPRPVLKAIVTRTTIDADGSDTAFIFGLPANITVKVDGEEHVLADGTLEISSDMPATYVIEIDHFPYMPWSTEIVAE